MRSPAATRSRRVAASPSGEPQPQVACTCGPLLATPAVSNPCRHSRPPPLQLHRAPAAAAEARRGAPPPAAPHRPQPGRRRGRRRQPGELLGRKLGTACAVVQYAAHVWLTACRPWGVALVCAPCRHPNPPTCVPLLLRSPTLRLKSRRRRRRRRPLPTRRSWRLRATCRSERPCVPCCASCCRCRRSALHICLPLPALPSAAGAWPSALTPAHLRQTLAPPPCRLNNPKQALVVRLRHGLWPGVDREQTFKEIGAQLGFSGEWGGCAGRPPPRLQARRGAARAACPSWPAAAASRKGRRAPATVHHAPPHLPCPAQVPMPARCTRLPCTASRPCAAARARAAGTRGACPWSSC